MPIEIGASIATLKAVGAALQAAGKIELRQQVLDLQQTMLEAIAENTQLTSDINRLTRDLDDARKEIRDLHGRLKVRQELTLDDEAYHRCEKGQKVAGPFCPKCYVGNDKVSPSASGDPGRLRERLV